MNNDIIQCNDKKQYYIGLDLMTSIKAQGDLTNNALLDLVINNPKVFLSGGLFELEQFNDHDKEQAIYDPDLEVLTYNGVEHDLCIDEYELEFDQLNACYDFSATLENGDYIYLSWEIDESITPTEISNPPLDFNKPYVTEYYRNS